MHVFDFDKTKFLKKIKVMTPKQVPLCLSLNDVISYQSQSLIKCYVSLQEHISKHHGDTPTAKSPYKPRKQRKTPIEPQHFPATGGQPYPQILQQQVSTNDRAIYNFSTCTNSAFHGKWLFIQMQQTLHESRIYHLRRTF